MRINDVNAYSEGQQASRAHNSNPKSISNPYPINSGSWESWNYGWNSYWDPSWLKEITGVIPDIKVAGIK